MLLEAAILLPMELQKSCCRWRAWASGTSIIRLCSSFPSAAPFAFKDVGVLGTSVAASFAINAVLLIKVLAMLWHAMVAIVDG